MNQNQKYFIDAQREFSLLQMLPFKVKNMQKNSNNNNNNYIWCIFIIESYCNFTVFTMKYYCIHYHIYNVSWSLSLHC